MLYAVAVIGVSALLGLCGWIAASDVLALNKEEHSVTVTITPEDSYDDVVDMLKDNGLIEYKSLFKLFSAITGGKDKIASSGTFTLNSDMDYRALISGISANSASRAVVDVTIPEGYTVAQIFQLLEEKGVATVEDLNETAATHDYAFSFLQDIPLGDPERLEGYPVPRHLRVLHAPTIPCTPSTRCFRPSTPSSPMRCARRWRTADVPSTRCSLWPP